MDEETVVKITEALRKNYGVCGTRKVHELMDDDSQSERPRTWQITSYSRPRLLPSSIR